MEPGITGLMSRAEFVPLFIQDLGQLLLYLFQSAVPLQEGPHRFVPGKYRGNELIGIYREALSDGRNGLTEGAGRI